MLISTRADASSHSLREPYHLPHGGVVRPMGCEVLYMGTSVCMEHESYIQCGCPAFEGRLCAFLAVRSSLLFLLGQYSCISYC
jgi:hypothetical protein